MNAGYAPFIAHMGISCFDIDRMVDFYSHVFELKVTDRGVGFTFPFKLAFMSAHASQHHELAPLPLQDIPPAAYRNDRSGNWG